MSVVIQIKGIKPKKLQIEAIRSELEKALVAEGEDVKKLYEQTTRTWRHKPDFEVLTDLGANDATVLVGTDDEIYQYVDKGTRAHRIIARRAPALRFQLGFTPKTTPGVIGSGRGKRFGAMVRPKSVMHPGTKPRNFSETIQAARKRKFTQRMIAAMRAGAKRAF